MKVKDLNGNVVQGLYRSAGGGLMVNNPFEYNKYIREKESAAELTHLKEEVDQLKQLVKTLLDKQAVRNNEG